MARTFSSLADLLAHDFDTVIDVRSPAEFAEDHMPGAINLPALDDAQRAEVGTVYVQDCPFNARKMGAAMVARNVADHIDQNLSAHEGGWRPLVYCWRGGQRSNSVASILSQIGWRAEVVDGGYRTFRRMVNDMLYQKTLPHRVVLLDGNTGTAKTDILNRLHTRDVQVVDLEGLAGHRGSLLGLVGNAQPSQKAFETELAVAFSKLDPARIVVLEAESSKIGERCLPPSVWALMCAAPRIVIEAPLAARATFLTHAYADMVADPTALKERVEPLVRLRGHEAVGRWSNQIDSGEFTELAADLMATHYDPSYEKSRKIETRDILATIRSETLDEADREHLADQIATQISAL
jgi:tRNA 2-selenouridine synthase